MMGSLSLGKAAPLMKCLLSSQRSGFDSARPIPLLEVRGRDTFIPETPTALNTEAYGGRGS